jgi:predicted nuclease of predicted toxin-antitoxin system
MRFLADESCDFAVVRALRAAGHDVVAIAEVTPRAEDDAVIDLAVREERLLLTEDKDFGQLVYARGRRPAGVLLLRFPTSAREALPKVVVNLVRRRGERLVGCFVVVQPGRIRIGRSPGG